MTLEYTTFTHINRNYIALKCFIESSIVPTCYIPVDYLSDCLKYGILSAVVTVTEQKNSDNYEFSNDKYKIGQLLKECPEVREFARQYYPEHVI